MVYMKRAVFFVVMGGLSLTGAVLGCLSPLPAIGAELNGFAINTQDKAVTVTLFTDQRVPYVTEHQGKQFSILLPNTQISPEQMSNGLPVVVDNKNRFIGRAVPAEDGKVRIILPNLSDNDYTVSIQQKRTIAKSTGEAAAKPRPITNLTNTNTFEQAVNGVTRAFSSEATPSQRLSVKDGNGSGMLKLSPSIHPLIERGQNTRNIIWNPYATRPPRQTIVHDAPEPTKLIPVAQEPIHLSQVETPQPQVPSFQPNFPTVSAMSAHDPFWAIRGLPPTNLNSLPTADLKALAAQDAQTQAASKAAPAETKKAESSEQTSYIHGLMQEIRSSFKSIPKWLWITLAVFLGGIGIFTLFGGLMLLKMLFVQAPPPQIITTQASPSLDKAEPNESSSPKPYVSQPERRTHKSRNQRQDFEDKSSISALDYLKQSPDSVSKAVQNTTLLKLPNQKKYRNPVNKTTRPKKIGEPAYGFRP